MKLEIGYKAEDKNDKLFEVMRTGKACYNQLPVEVFGMPIEGKIMPIFDGSEIVGAVIYSTSTQKREKIAEDLGILHTHIGQTNQEIVNIIDSGKELDQCLAGIQKVSAVVGEQVKDAASIVNSIQSNVSHSNILALNASIESARAGQAGRGFSVVAEEMRKFSKMSGDSAKKIHDSLKQMMESLEEVLKTVEQSSMAAEKQKQAVAQNNDSFSTITEAAQDLVNMSSK